MLATEPAPPATTRQPRLDDARAWARAATLALIAARPTAAITCISCGAVYPNPCYWGCAQSSGRPGRTNATVA